MKKVIIKNVAISILTILCLTGLMLFIFRDNMPDIASALGSLSPLCILVLIFLGTAYQLLEGLTCFCLFKGVKPSFRYRQAMDVIYLGVFGKSSFIPGGTFPMQAFYMKRCGVEVGQSAGVKALNYVIHKTAIVVFASVMLFAGGGWIRSAAPDIHGYLMGGYVICAIIIIFLILLCTWKRAHMLAVWLIEKLPERGKWKTFKIKIKKQLDCMYFETAECIRNRKMLLPVLIIHLIKLTVYCSAPYACMRMLGIDSLSLAHVVMLTSLMLLIANAVPNIAGIGPIEVVFMLTYRPLLGEVLTSSALILFRISTYYFPFVTSVIVFLAVETRALSRKRKAAEEKKGNGISADER